MQLVSQTQQTTDQKRWTFHEVSFHSAKFGQKQTKDAWKQSRLFVAFLWHDDESKKTIQHQIRQDVFKYISQTH